MDKDTVFITGSRLLDRLLIYRTESQLTSLRLNNEKLSRHDMDKNYMLSFAECESGIDIMGKLLSATGQIQGYCTAIDVNDRITFGTVSKWFCSTANGTTSYFMKESLGQTPSASDGDRSAPQLMGIIDDDIADHVRIATIYDMEREDTRLSCGLEGSGCFVFNKDQYAGVETIVLRTRFGKHQMPSQTVEEICREHLADKTVLYTTVDDMRRAGFNIRKGLSWEQLTFETCRAIRSVDCLAGFRAVIVKYDNEGFLLYNDGEASITYYANSMENEMSAQATGRVFGSTIAVEAALTHTLLTAESDESFLTTLCKGMTIGLDASHELLASGYADFGGKPGFPLQSIADIIVEREAAIHDICSLDELFADSNMAHIQLNRKIIDHELSQMRRDRLISRNVQDKERFSFCYELIGSGQERMEDFAKRLVQDGLPRTIRNVGHLRVGNFVTLDREEAEEIRSIQNLLRLYIENEKARQPFSIAIFGQPGSGKSFVVKQIAKSFHLDSHSTFTFNLSQMTSIDHLIEAFHQVRDSCLKGNIPVVFFDEFDSQFGGRELGWLKYFLSPMQDGTFLEGALEHTIGKSVFVFAGGTCHSMKEFSQMAAVPDDKGASADSAQIERAKAAADTKAPDFISRLKGYLNVLGINPTGGQQALEQHLHLLDADSSMSDFDERLYLRRAILLRSSLEQKVGLQQGERINVEENVLNAFLRVWRYTHGARSMETLIQTSDIVRGYNFSASCLYNNNLDMHVSADFLYHLDRES